MTRLRRLLAAFALAAVTAATAVGCQNPVQAPVPAPPSCPSGQHWAALSTTQWGCTADAAS